MNNGSSDPKLDEQKLVRMYMDLTGAPESEARSVFMHVCDQLAEKKSDAALPTVSDAPEIVKEKAYSGVPAPALAATVACLLGLAVPAVHGAALAGESTLTNAAAATFPFSQPLSLADAVNLALTRNPNVLRAQKDLEATHGIILQTRAIALPTVNIGGTYGAAEKSDVDTFNAPGGFTFGTPQNWSTQVKLVQSVYQGGRMLSAIRAARLAREQSMLNYQTVLANTVLEVQLAYYRVLLAEQQITVQEASVELLTRELADTQRRFDAGTVPRFNVLRAEVELANARPRLITARNSFRIGKNNLLHILGFSVPREIVEDIPLTLSGKLEAEPYELELRKAIDQALERRTELAALHKAQALRKEDIVTAKAGYKPVLQGYVGYDAHNSMLSQDLTDELHGWIAGAQLSWNLFDGLRTQGRIQEATANYERAGIDVEDTARRIELDVRTAYSNFIQAREVLESQKKVVEEAEEALRLARARNEAGSGTQLDVLSAQTALTEARTTQIQALHDYEAARARLQRAVGMNVPSQTAR